MNFAKIMLAAAMAAGTVVSLEANDDKGNYNEAATKLFISQAKSGTMTPEKLKKFKSKNADINATYQRTDGTQTNLFLESVFFPNSRDIRERNDGGFNYTPAYMNRQKVLIALIDLKVNTNVVDGKGRNAICLAILNIGNDKYRDEIIKYLHKTAHVNINEADNFGGTPLMYAIIRTGGILRGKPSEIPALVAYLIKENANVNAADKDGNTVLMYAAQFSTLATVKSLIKYGAKLSAKNKNGATAVDCAAKAPEVRKYLEEKMLDNL